MSSNLLLLMTSSGIRSIIFWVAVVMVDHLCFDPRRRASPGSEHPDGRPPDVNFPASGRLGAGGILRSVWYHSYCVNRTHYADFYTTCQSFFLPRCCYAVRP